MTWIKSKEKPTFREPDEITPDIVQFYSKHTKELKNSQVNKAKKFVEFDCIRYVADQSEYAGRYDFICLPLNTKTEVIDKHTGRLFKKEPYSSDYNKTIYTIQKVGKTFECNCQFWQTKKKKGEIKEEGANCCHILALYYAFKMKRFRRNR